MAVPNTAHNDQSMVPAAPRLNRGEKGAEIVEFALIFGVLMTLMLGIVSFARAYNVYQTITRAAREGVRMAVLPTAWDNGNGGAYMDASTANVSQTGQVCQSGSWTAASGPTNVFNNYIAPVLRSANLDPCEVSNYTEQVKWLDSSNTQCGVVISFQYPYNFSIPFLPALDASPIEIGTRVQMRTEGQPTTGLATACQGQYP
jgi:hypothetical protein